VTALNGPLEFPVCLLRSLNGSVERNDGPDGIRETVKRVDKCNHDFGLVSVSLAAANAESSHILPGAQVIFIAAVHFAPLPRKRAA
jgi:hypothetical protein